MAEKQKPVKGITKAAMMLVALGDEVAAEILRNLDERSVEKISMEVSRLKAVSAEKLEPVIEEFYQLSLAQEYIARGGLDYARSMLEKALGPQKAIEIISRLQRTMESNPLEALKDVDPQQLLNFIQNEQPQTIALIIAFLTPEQASVILGGLSEEMRIEVVKRVARMDQISPDMIKEIQDAMETQLMAGGTGELSFAGGIQIVSEMLNRSDQTTEKSIMAGLEREDPELAEEIKKLMFVFEDIILLDNQSIRTLLTEVDNKDLALALKAASDALKEKIFSNMSERASSMIIEDMDFMGPVRLKDVEEAQQKILDVVRRLEEEGKILVSRGGDEDKLIE